MVARKLNHDSGTPESWMPINSFPLPRLVISFAQLMIGAKMPFKPVQPEKLAHAVVHQIEQLILRGILRPGERLPSERDLSEKISVSRPSLRDAIAHLSETGLLETRAGSGVFVSEKLGSTFPKPLTEIFARHEEAALDYLSFRRDMEGLAGERAAKHASDTDLKIINTIFEKMEAAHPKRNPSDEAALDADFHLSIIEASHNVIMLHMMRSMFDLLRTGVFYNRQTMFKQRITRRMLLDQHRAINEALQSRDPATTRAAIEAHLEYVEAAMKDQQQADHNEEIARLRLEQELVRKY